MVSGSGLKTDTRGCQRPRGGTPDQVAQGRGQRLRARCTDDEAVIVNRIKNAKDEITAVGEYDFTIINDTVELAAKQFVIVAKAARLKQSTEDEEKFVTQWLANN